MSYATTTKHRGIVVHGVVMRGGTVRIHSVWIRYDSDEPVVSEARMEITIDEDVFLCEIVSDSQGSRLVVRTGLRSLCMISIECRYCNPLAASASFGGFRILPSRKK
jgi:hypothetical protein